MVSIESITTVSLVKPNSKSYRSSVPQEVIKALGIQNGDKIKWKIDPVDNEYKITIEKLE